MKLSFKTKPLAPPGKKGVKNGLFKLEKKKSAKPLPARVKGVFSVDDDTKRAPGKKRKRSYKDAKTDAMLAAALAEDPNAFAYDEVVDDLQAQRQAKAEEVKAEKVARKPKYLQRLMERAKDRQTENEIRMDRRNAREREKEDYLYKDKQKFVTSAFKKQQEERLAFERRQLAEAKAERDQTKNMTLFRKNMLTGRSADSMSHHLHSKEKTEARAEAKAKREEASSSSSSKMVDDDDTTSSSSRANVVGVGSSRGSSDRTPVRDSSSRQEKQQDTIGTGADSDSEDAPPSSKRRRVSADIDAGGAKSDDHEEATSSDGERAAKAHKAKKTNVASASSEDGEDDGSKKAEDVVKKWKEKYALPEKIRERPAMRKKVPLSRRNDKTSVMSARERYLARKAAKLAARSDDI